MRSDEAAIEKLIEGLSAAEAQGDARAVAAYFTENAVLAQGTAVIAGRLNIEQAMSVAFADGGMEGSGNRTIRLLSPTTAIVYGPFESDSPSVKGHEIATLQKEGDRWLIAAVQVAIGVPEE